ncbi:MAG: DUF1684 domain-containing protein [Halobacteria archaeon]|nr:DUF1684 domain-containing protein [Halobacteria archaeon]
MSWKDDVREFRDEKDEFFRESPQSPIPEDERADFDGLDYFRVDGEYRFELELHEHDDKETVVIETTTGGEREYLRWGEFRFEVDGENCVLQAYKAEADDHNLWVPFRDDTNGDETYGAGRYLDIDEGNETNGNRVVDFNRAYNPFCAYSEEYDCPFIPTENWLDVRIEAGEKSYESKEGYEYSENS